MLILVVEDSPTQSLLIRRTLGEHGHTVITAADGLEGLTLVKEKHPNVVISDIAMPAMDGFALCREIKQDPQLNEVRVVLLTTLSDPKEVLRGLTAGADFYLVKPYDEQQLAVRLATILGVAMEDRCREMAGGLEVRFANEHHLVHADRRQIMTLLLSTYENAAQQNSELLKAQAELRRLNERKAELAQEEQTRLLKELESTNRELKEFAYIVSHDLKAPLRAIESLVQWISDDYASLFDEEGREQMRLLSGRVRRMQNLIEGVLHYSRIGRIREETSPINLSRLLPQVLDSLAPPAHVVVKIADRLPVIHGEKVRIQQLWQNLLSNAIKFMDKPHGLVEIGCQQEETFWHFTVTDNGPGIDRRDFDRIFQIFQTLHSRDEYESTGVGLTLVKKIVEMHGGKVWVASEVGQGSTFHFTLPASLL